MKSYLARVYSPVLLIMAGYLGLALYFGGFLHLDFLWADVEGYWQDSLNWQMPFQTFHVPGYPLAIAVFRAITFDTLPPIILMMGINLIALSASVILIYRILTTGGVSGSYAVVGALLFGLWPFVGLSYTVMPLADLPALALCLAGLYALQRSRTWYAAVFLGLSLITHKVMWLVAGLIIVFDILYRKDYFSKRNLLFLGIVLLPVGILWLSGSMYHNSVTWILADNLEAEVASRGSLPILDGIVGTLGGGGIKEVLKGAVITGFAVTSAVSLFLSTRLEQKYIRYTGIAISTAILILFVILNQREIWAAVRFSRLLAIPLVLVAYSRFNPSKPFRWNLPVVVAFVCILFLSQFVYLWWLAHLFSGVG